MQFKSSLKMRRSDVEIDHRQVLCPNSEFFGYSKKMLRVGDFFTYKDGEVIRLGRMHHRLKVSKRIVAQVAVDGFLSNHCERWVDPKDVLYTRRTEKMDPEVVALFDKRSSMWER